jgi:hypothetical protein
MQMQPGGQLPYWMLGSEKASSSGCILAFRSRQTTDILLELNRKSIAGKYQMKNLIALEYRYEIIQCQVVTIKSLR